MRAKPFSISLDPENLLTGTGMRVYLLATTNDLRWRLHRRHHHPSLPSHSKRCCTRSPSSLLQGVQDRGCTDQLRGCEVSLAGYRHQRFQPPQGHRRSCRHRSFSASELMLGYWI
ncbi:hypothetical protein DEO72_LG8g1997 [Vigna unguiculata]|uniref:Uncharacterized protein n=1 Tax=Vigna unguiculata TaxID=3917 RepID=A0A4D6MVN9_VIGUN|nr:hypothetical protein DEO72_LG8g1997 [Vigna unguiculata]